MKLIFHRPHLSITAFASIEMPDFAILTGLNGSGKTHLLQAIQGKRVLIEGVDASAITAFGPTDLVKTDEGGIGEQSENLKIGRCLQLLNFHRDGLKQLWERIESEKRNGIQLDEASEVRKFLEQKQGESKQPPSPRGGASASVSEYQSLMHICDMVGKKILDVTLADIRSVYPVFVEPHPRPQTGGKISPVPTEISGVFWRYYSKEYHNNLNEFLNKKDGGNRPVLSEEEFRAVNGREPWDILNDLLENHFKIPYRVNSPRNPAGDGTMPPVDMADHYTFQLLHIGKNLNMNFSNLSSGEKLMMALVMSMYKSLFKTGKFPRVLLLDETDAVLHPSTVQQALDIIQHCFVNQQRMKVLMATHSPSTVAYAPEDSIYVMNPPGKEPRVEKQDKQTALSILTEGVVSFVFDSDARMKIRHSIRTRRKPLLLVEGFTDFLIIQKAWEKIRGTEIPFDIMDCFSAGLLRATLQNADDIVGKGESAKVFGLFDYDAAGYSQWEALKSGRWSDISAEDVQVKKSQEHEWHALLLPVPARLSEQAGGKHAKDSRLEIEHLFSGHPDAAGFFVEEEGIGGGKIIAFRGSKRKFAEQVVPTLPKEAFADFEPLFRFITEQIAPPAKAGGQG